MDNHTKKKNIEDALYNILYGYYKKHKSLPSLGRCMVHRGLLTHHDMIDYTLDKTNELTKISYMYYENYKDEEKYYSSSFCIQ